MPLSSHQSMLFGDFSFYHVQGTHEHKSTDYGYQSMVSFTAVSYKIMESVYCNPVIISNARGHKQNCQGNRQLPYVHCAHAQSLWADYLLGFLHVL